MSLQFGKYWIRFFLSKIDKIKLACKTISCQKAYNIVVLENKEEEDCKWEKVHIPIIIMLILHQDRCGTQAMHVAEDVGTIIKIVYLVKLVTFIFCVDLATFNSLTLK